MSNRNRKKPPSQRRERTGPTGEKPRCVICDSRDVTIVGFWQPDAAHATFLGSSQLAYTACRQCAAMPGFIERVELTILSRHEESHTPAEQPPIEEADLESLGRISTFGGFMTVEGESLPIVVPLEETDDHRGFDRLVCELGLKKFLRPVWESDRRHIQGLADRLEEPEIASNQTHILIEELSPGVRKRKSIQYFPEGSLN